MLVDDHALFRTGLRMVLEASDRVGEIVEAGSLDEALALGNQGARVDAVLLDILMPGLSGLDGVTLLKKHLHKVPVIMLSSQADAATVRQAKLRGAEGFVSKAAAAEEIFRAIEKVLAGRTYYFADSGNAPVTPIGQADEGAAASAAERPPLTVRQLEVLCKLCLGLSNKLIARQLGVSENTVRVHVAAIFAYLNVVNRSEALLKAQRLGIVRQE